MKVRLKTLYKPNRYRFRLMLEQVDLSEVIFLLCIKANFRMNHGWMLFTSSIYLLSHFRKITNLGFYSVFLPFISLPYYFYFKQLKVKLNFIKSATSSQDLKRIPRSKIVQKSVSRAIYTRGVKRQYGICWLKKELSMVQGVPH